MRCHDGWSSFTHSLHPMAYSNMVGDSAQGLWELEAWDVSEGHCAFLGKALHLGPIQRSVHMSMMCSSHGGVTCMPLNSCRMYNGHISFHNRAGHGCKPCFLPPKHRTSNMRSMSTFSILAAVIAFNTLGATICQEYVSCFVCSLLLLFCLLAKIKCMLFIDFPFFLTFTNWVCYPCL